MSIPASQFIPPPQDILKVEGNLNKVVGALLAFGLFKSREILFPLLPLKPCFPLRYLPSLLRVLQVLGAVPVPCMLSLVVFRAHEAKWLLGVSRLVRSVEPKAHHLPPVPIIPASDSEGGKNAPNVWVSVPKLKIMPQCLLI